MVSTTLCTSGAALLKAGANKNSNLALLEGADASNYYVDELIMQAEGIINATCRYNWSAEVSAGNVNREVVGILEDWSSNLAAMALIEYDMNGFNSSRQAEAMLDILNNANVRNQSILRDKKAEDFVNAA